jgi:dihydrofolate reductase
MHPIIYDVAVSLDGFISGPSGDISKFAHEGRVVDDYLTRMNTYATAIMGRSTYEFGYAFGLKPGQNPYPNMQTHVFSRTLECPGDGQITVHRQAKAEELRRLKSQSNGPIYLCGGGTFAGWLLEAGLIDRVVLKRAPVVYGNGVSLFGRGPISKSLTRTKCKAYDNGYLLEEFEV